MRPSLLCRLRKQEALFSFSVARALLPACPHLEPIHPWWECLNFPPDGGKLGQWCKFPAPQRYTWMTLMCVSLATWLTAPSFILDIRPRCPSDFLIIPCNSLADQLSPIHQDTCIYARWMKKNTELIPLSGKIGSNKEPVRPVENSCWMAICESYLHDPELPGLGLIAQFVLLPLQLAQLGLEATKIMIWGHWSIRIRGQQNWEESNWPN